MLPRPQGGGSWRHRRSSLRRRADAGCGYSRSALAAADDSEIRTEGDERFRRRQANAIGGTRDEDLLISHSAEHPIQNRPDDRNLRHLASASPGGFHYQPLGFSPGAFFIGLIASTQ